MNPILITGDLCDKHKSDHDGSFRVLPPAFQSYGKPIAPHTGVNGKRQVNLFDPDGTRVELMESETANGKLVPPSTAPPPN